MTTGTRVGTSRHGPLFFTGLVVGWGIIAFGVRGLLGDQATDRVVNWAVYLVGLDLLHDAVVAPAALLVGAAVARALPRSWRAPVQAGLFASAVVLLLAAAPLADTAEPVGNPTIQPLDYGTATLTALGISWAAVVGVTLAHRWWRRRGGSSLTGYGPGS